MSPGESDQSVIVGSNGSGKTQFAVFLLSTRPWRRKPYVIIDYKRDSLIAQIGAKEIKVTDKPPTKPGLYVMHPRPEVDNEALEVFMLRCWEQENIGLFFDEGYMIPKGSPAFRALMTQGRSKKIERIILSQRPVWMDRFVFSEGTYFNVFRLTDKRDRDTVKTMVPAAVDGRLPPFHSHYYGVREDKLVTLGPAPTEQEIVARFRPPRNANRSRAI